MATSKVPPFQTYASQIPQTVRPDRMVLSQQLVEMCAGGDVNKLVVADGTTQLDATPLPNASVILITGGNGTNGVIIPNGGPDTQAILCNASLSSLYLYPPIGGTINGGAVDYPITLAPISSMLLVSITRNNWVTVGGIGGSGGPPGAAADPVMSPAGSAVTSGQAITMTCATAGASIRYTTNGSTPSDTVGTVYSDGAKPTISAATTIKAIAYKAGLDNSGVVTASYTLTPVANPVLSPSGGEVTFGQAITMTCTTAGASIRYTTNGSTPSDTVGTVYSDGAKPTISAATTIKAIAYKAGMPNSSVVTQPYTIPGPVSLSMPSGFTWGGPPIEIYRDGGGNITTNLDPKNYDVARTATIYISPTGSNANNGLTVGAPKANLSGVVTRSGGLTTSTRIIAEPGIYIETPGNNSIVAAEYSVVPSSGRAIFVGGGRKGPDAVLHSGAAYKWQSVTTAAGGASVSWYRTSNISYINFTSATGIQAGVIVFISGMTQASLNGLKLTVIGATGSVIAFTDVGANSGSSGSPIADTGGACVVGADGVVDLATLGVGTAPSNVPHLLTRVATAAEVVSTAGSWTMDATTVYFRLLDGRVPDNNAIGFSNCSVISNRMLRLSRGGYFENCTIIGGHNSITHIGTVIDANRTFVFNNCMLLAPSKQLTDGLACTDGDGFSFYQDTIIAHQSYDGFNYTGTGVVDPCGLEVRCTVYGVGTAIIQGGNNCSTCHAGWRIIRAGGTYKYAGNKCLADIADDVLGGGSWNISCTVGLAAGSGADTGLNTNVAISCGGPSPFLGAKVWLDGCIVNPAENTIQLQTIGDGKIYYRNMNITGWNNAEATPGDIAPY